MPEDTRLDASQAFITVPSVPSGSLGTVRAVYLPGSSAPDSYVRQQIRASVAGIKQRLELGLAIVTAMAAGCPSFIRERLDQLMQHVTPLLASPLVGESGAYEAALALARCLPPPALAAAAVSIAAALRLVQMSASTGAQAARHTEHPRSPSKPAQPGSDPFNCTTY